MSIETSTITRAQLVAAVEDGITNAISRYPGGLTQTDIASLRFVGATAPNILIGNFEEAGFTCPLCAAGIMGGPAKELNYKSDRYAAALAFYAGFDKYCDSLPDIEHDCLRIVG